MKGFVESYEAAFISGMVEKLGVTGVQPSDTTLIADLLTWMETTRQDFTSTFRLLSSGLRSQTRPFCDGEFAAWHGRWLIRIGEDDHTEVARRMDAVNPTYIPRNHLVEEALEAAVGGDLTPFNRLLAVLGEPYEERAEDARYAEPAPSEFGVYQTFCGT
jgi:serine/tyrosine/threonine adenylyltransferase